MNTASSSSTTIVDRIHFADVSCLITLSKDQRASIAEDTLSILQAGWYRPHRSPRIDLAIDVTFCVENSVLYTEDDLQNMTKPISAVDQTDPTPSTMSSPIKIEVRHCTTLQAAQSFVAEIDEDPIGVLNFASAKNPGGGFLRGASGQEDSIARSSSLYSALTQERFFRGYYCHNRHANSGIYTHRLIYSPRDDNGHLLSSPYHVGIVTVPAPNASIVRDAEAIRHAMTERIKHLLNVFKANQHDCLILGAFGCGIFRNSPFDVATLFRKHLVSKEFQNSFKRIIFAVSEEKVCQVFEQVFADTCSDHMQQDKQIAKRRRN